MRTFEQLSTDEKKQAINICVVRLTNDIVSGLRFNDKLNQDNFQASIDKVLAKAEQLRTPWFAGEMLLENNSIREELESMAECDAEDELYPDKGEKVPTYIHLS